MSVQIRPRIRIAALIEQEDGVLLVRHEKDGRDYWLLPGGGVDFGEALTDALSREVWEETRLRIAPGPLLLASDTIAPDGSRHVVHLVFAARILEGVPRLGEDPRVVEVRFVPVHQLRQIEVHPPIGDVLATYLETRSAPGYIGTLWRD